MRFGSEPIGGDTSANQQSHDPIGSFSGELEILISVTDIVGIAGHLTVHVRVPFESSCDIIKLRHGFRPEVC
jgi:hypothetical protein